MRWLLWLVASFCLICFISGTIVYVWDKRESVSRTIVDVKDTFQSLPPKEQDKLLKSVTTQTEELAPELRNAAEARLKEHARMPSERIQERIDQLDQDISAFQTVETLARLKALMRGDEQALLAAFRGDLEQQLRIQEKTYLEEILPTVRANEQAAAIQLAGTRALEQARQKEQRARIAVILARCKLRGVSGPCRLSADPGIPRSADDPAVKEVKDATDRLRNATRQRAEAETLLANRKSRLTPVQEAVLAAPSAEETLKDLETEAAREAKSWSKYVIRDGSRWAIKMELTRFGGRVAV